MRTLDQTIQGQVDDIKQHIAQKKIEGAPSSTIRQDVHDKAMLNMEHEIMYWLLKYLEELMRENLNRMFYKAMLNKEHQIMYQLLKYLGELMREHLDRMFYNSKNFFSFIS